MSHTGGKFLYENGAFRLFNVAMPEEAIQRCKEHASYVDGSLWRIEKGAESETM